MRECLKANLKDFLKKGKYNIFYKFYHYIKMYQYSGKYIKNKNAFNVKDKVYIIKNSKSSSGFFADFFYVLSHIVFASKKGYKIVVDMENYPTLYSEKELFLGTKNAWEYYFEQPDNIFLEIVQTYQHIIVSAQYCRQVIVPGYTYFHKCAITKDMIMELGTYIDRYIKIRQEILDEVDGIKKKWGAKILGVHIRGTDMKNAFGHPIPPSIARYQKEIDAILTTYEVDKIFCCTDEEAILEEVKTIYNDLIVYTSSLKSTNGQAVHKNKEIEREHHNYLLGKEVLMDALLLSRCDYLICGHSNVAYAAMVFNKNQYKNLILLESNEYTMD